MYKIKVTRCKNKIMPAFTFERVLETCPRSIPSGAECAEVSQTGALVGMKKAMAKRGGDVGRADFWGREGWADVGDT